MKSEEQLKKELIAELQAQIENVKNNNRFEYILTSNTIAVLASTLELNVYGK